MKRTAADSGLRRHRPRRRFRFEYIKGRFSGVSGADRLRRAFDEAEKEQDGYEHLVERFERYRRRAGLPGDAGRE